MILKINSKINSLQYVCGVGIAPALFVRVNISWSSKFLHWSTRRQYCPNVKRFQYRDLLDDCRCILLRCSYWTKVWEPRKWHSTYESWQIFERSHHSWFSEIKPLSVCPLRADESWISSFLNDKTKKAKAVLFIKVIFRHEHVEAAPPRPQDGQIIQRMIITDVYFVYPLAINYSRWNINLSCTDILLTILWL